MRAGSISIMLTVVVLAAPATIPAAPPARPLELTTAQFDHLQELETRTGHVAVLDVHATYKSEREQALDRTRTADDISTGVALVGMPAAIVILLIAAAPL